MKRFIYFLILVICVLTIVLIGLQVGNQGKSQKSPQQVTENQMRLVSVSPNITEILFALGLEEEVVGVTDYCNYPVAATAKKSIGTIMEPDLETILSLKPTNIFLTNTAFHIELGKKLSSLGLNTFFFDVDMFKGISSTISQIGETTNRAEQSNRLNSDIAKGLNSIKAIAAGFSKTPTVLVVLQSEPLIVVGKNTYIDELITIAGGTNAISDLQHTYPMLNAEALITLDPDIIVETQLNVEPARSEKALSGYKWDIEAVRNKNVFVVDADIISRPGPRVVEAGRQMQRIIQLYFGDNNE